MTIFSLCVLVNTLDAVFKDTDWMLVLRLHTLGNLCGRRLGPMVDKSMKIGPPAAHILETEVQGDISLYDARQERVLILNGTASDVWRLCDGEQVLDEIVDLLANAYQVDSAAIHVEVEQTVRQLINEGFLPER